MSDSEDSISDAFRTHQGRKRLPSQNKAAGGGENKRKRPELFSLNDSSDDEQIHRNSGGSSSGKNDGAPHKGIPLGTSSAPAANDDVNADDDLINSHRKKCDICKQEKCIESPRFLEGVCDVCTEAYVGAVRKKRTCGICHNEKERLDFSPSQWYRCELRTRRIRNSNVFQQCLSCQEEERFILDSDGDDDDNGANDKHQQYRMDVMDEVSRGCWKRDRHTVITLLQEKCDDTSTGTTFYDCDAAIKDPRNRLALESFPSCDGNCEDLKDFLGVYDVTFVRYESRYRDDVDYNFMQRRTIHGRLDLYVTGGETSQLQCILTLDSPHWLNAGHGVPPGFSFVFQEDGECVVDKVDALYCGGGKKGMEKWLDTEEYASYSCEANFQLVHRRMSFDWIPCEDVPGQSHYAQQMRMEAERVKGRRSILWLCHHTIIPEGVTCLIREYLGVHVPENLNFVLEEDDLWVSIEFGHYSSSDILNFAAQRRRH